MWKSNIPFLLDGGFDFDIVHRGFGFEDRNEGGVSLLDFAKTFELVIANSSFL